MNMFQNSNNNIFTIREERFKIPRFRKEYVNGFSFNNMLKSDNFEELQFTNFVKSENTNKYNDLKEICNKVANNYYELDKLFSADEIDINIDIPKLNRVFNILEKANENSIDRKKLILKYKNKKDKEIQFYIMNENGNYKLMLVDLYHLVIEATNVKTGRKDLKGIYKFHKNYSYNINNIQIN